MKTVLYVFGTPLSEVFGTTFSEVFGTTLSEVFGTTFCEVFEITLSKVFGATLSEVFGTTLSEVFGTTLSEVFGSIFVKFSGLPLVKFSIQYVSFREVFGTTLCFSAIEQNYTTLEDHRSCPDLTSTSGNFGVGGIGRSSRPDVGYVKMLKMFRREIDR